METLKDILWPVVLVGGSGAFIDFLIGKTGQQKAKDWLLKWWVRFDDVRWKNFGREEGLFAGRLIEPYRDSPGEGRVPDRSCMGSIPRETIAMATLTCLTPSTIICHHM
jgi:hypothetical protein